MRTILLLLLLILAVIACLYLVIRTAWQKLDVISAKTENYIKIHSDPNFDAEEFRFALKRLLSRYPFSSGYPIIFHTPFYERGARRMILNAHTGLPGSKVILFSPGWAVKLFRAFEGTQSDKEISMTIDLFAFVLGHEISHKEQKHRPVFLFGKKRICADWIREIGADFGGLKKTGLPPQRVAYCLRNETLNKRSPHINVRKTRLSPVSHPTWEYRIQCWEAGQFDETIIEKICRDCDVDDLRFRNKMKNYYISN